MKSIHQTVVDLHGKGHKNPVTLIEILTPGNLRIGIDAYFYDGSYEMRVLYPGNSGIADDVVSSPNKIQSGVSSLFGNHLQCIFQKARDFIGIFGDDNDKKLSVFWQIRKARMYFIVQNGPAVLDSIFEVCYL